VSWLINKSRVVSRKPRDAAYFSYAHLLIICYLLQVPKGWPFTYSSGSQLSINRLNVKINVTITITAPLLTCFETECIVTISRSSKVVDFDTNQKRACDFLLVLNSDLGRSYLAAFQRLELLYTESHFSVPHPCSGQNFRCSPWSRSVMFGVCRERTPQAN